MRTAESIAEVRLFVAAARRKGQSIGLVPTMGALHAGHLSLITAAQRACDVVVVSIFVNPTQFGPQEDLEAYPRPMEADLKQCRECGVDLVFHPSVADVYATGNLTWVIVDELTDPLCGQQRPGHFRGVTTVCAKLFNMVQPDKAFFGQKDAQQSLVIRRMAADLNLPLEIVVCPTHREDDGLALSSRNAYLCPEERRQAPVLYRSLQACRDRIRAGERDCRVLERQLCADLERASRVKVDYAAILDAGTLKPMERASGKLLLAVAVFMGSARLIDNIVVDVPGQRRIIPC